MSKLKFNKRITKYIIIIFIGLIISGMGVYVTAATITSSSNVSYNNKTSGLSATNMQGAIDEIYEKVGTGNFIAAYTYNQTSESNYCVTGKESTCKKTTCYKTKTSGSCPAGTIIVYKVNATETIPFHVMFDNGSTLTMQTQKDVLKDIMWWTQSPSSSYPDDISAGPKNLLDKLEQVTSDWNNINKRTYTVGTTNFSNKGYCTGCSAYNSCTDDAYAMSIRVDASSRIMTVQEAAALNCTNSSNSCPKWMSNYIIDEEKGYWLMNAKTAGSNAFFIENRGRITSNANTMKFSARAVVVVNK